MRCDDVIGHLAAFRHGELPAELSHSIEMHLGSCSACQTVLDGITKMEERLVRESMQWHQPSRGMQPVTLEQLRRQAAALTEVEKEALTRNVTPVVTYATEGNKPRSLLSRQWLRPLISLTAACLILVMVAPQVIMASVDVPGIGPWLQKMALQRVGLEWAVENGYVQGTVAQASNNDVTLRIIGVVADPVQTALIYLIQGLERPQEHANENELKAQRAGEIDASRSPIPETALPQVRIVSVDGQGTSSWSQRPTWTSLGLVGVVETHPLPNEQGAIEMALYPHGDGNEKVQLTLPVSRAAESKLATVVPLDYQKTVDGITVRGDRVILTPMQMRVEYSVEGGHNVNGSIPTEYASYLTSASGQRMTGHGGGSLNGAMWKYRAIFDRPSDLNGLTMVIPWLSKDVPIQLSWPFDADEPGQVALGTPVELKTRYVRPGEVCFELLWQQSERAWGFGGIKIYDAGGRLMDFNEQWVEGNSSSVYGFRSPERSTPDRLSINTLEQVVAGDWVIPIPTIK
ncbi:MAG: zf-HC2 domain-containing protein [Bacillota bacterium]